MSEPRRSTRARAREEAAPAPPETPAETPSKQSSRPLKRKRAGLVPTKDAVPGTGAETPQQPSKHQLPVRLAEAQSLPTLPAPQSLDLSPHEYQDIQQSGVLSASLQRSRAVWISGVNFRLFHAFFTPPKKVADRTEEDKQNIQQQKEIVRNFPQVGEAQLVIEPHTFPIRLYGPREVARQLPKKPSPYGQWPTHTQHTPYQYNNSPATSYQSTPQPRPTQPKPVPQKAPQPAPQANQTPAPDPVIHMLAQRAGQDPELKAVMKIVAAGQATKQQLEFFQGHINELTNIMQRQKEAAKAHPPPPPQPPPPPPKPVVAPPPPQPLPPMQVPPPPVHPVSKPYSSAPPQAYQPQMAPAPPHNAPYPTTHSHGYNQPQQYQQPQYMPASQPPRLTYRPLVFEFVEGNGDKFCFPSYSFMEWLNASQGAKFSFLITKMKSKPKPDEKVKVPSTPAPKVAPTTPAGPTPNATPNAPVPITGNMAPIQNITMTPGSVSTPAPPVTPYIPPPRIEDFDEKNDLKDIEFYQPLTVHILSNSTEVLQSLPRAVRPPDVVDKYMNDVFDTCRRAEETYLAFRLPREGVETESEDRRMKSGDATPTVSTPIAEIVMGGMGAPLEKKRSAGRPRKSLV